MECKQWEEMGEMVWHHCKIVVYVQFSIVHPSVFYCTMYYFAVAPTPMSQYTHESSMSTRCTTRKLITRHKSLIYITVTLEQVVCASCHAW